jgi:hypothetical protein
MPSPIYQLVYELQKNLSFSCMQPLGRGRQASITPIQAQVRPPRGTDRGIVASSRDRTVRLELRVGASEFAECSQSELARYSSPGDLVSPKLLSAAGWQE